MATRRHAPLIFNVQDVYPDVAVELGVLADARVIGLARRLERICYERADAVTVLSEDMKENVAAKTRSASTVRVIPNFVDTNTITPRPKDNAYRRKFGLGDKRVVMYAGNVGLSQSLDLIIEAAAALAYEEDLVFVVNGGGAARAALERRAEGLPNVRFVDIQPQDRLPEVLAAADLHIVPLERAVQGLLSDGRRAAPAGKRGRRERDNPPARTIGRRRLGVPGGCRGVHEGIEGPARRAGVVR